MSIHVKWFLIILGIGISLSLSAYEVCIEGVEDSELLEYLYSVSQLEKLKDSPPATAIGLKRRAENDIDTFVTALQSKAYYNAEAYFKIISPELIRVKIELGPLYPLKDFQIHFFQNGQEVPGHDFCITLEDLHVTLGDPALAEIILNAEDSLLDQLNLQGYAFATISKKDVLVDKQNISVKVIFQVETGFLAYFGPLTIAGNERVKQNFFYQKLRWCEGDLYDPRKIEKTQEALELSGLFRSVNIKYLESSNKQCLPMHIDVVEGKQRSIGFGLNYATTLGIGITSEWEDRNILGNGQKLGVRADLWEKLQEGSITYVVPDYRIQDQNLIWLAEYHREKTRAFLESAFSLSATIERQVNHELRISYGNMYKILRSERSNHNGTFDLIKVPLQLRWSNANSLLDPTYGATVNAKMIPSIQIRHPRFAYTINLLIGSLYHPLMIIPKCTLATKVMFGSILGASKFDIPPPERFYAGSENALRGYRYLTVSPISHHHHKPLGGRSLFIYSLEFRIKANKNWGWVFFYEIGNVFSNPFPDFSKGLLQSTGIGLRYHTPVGPLRVDFAIPLDRRRHLDGPYQLYFSIGQAF